MGLSHRYSPENLPTWGVCVSNPYWSGSLKVWLIWGQRISCPAVPGKQEQRSYLGKQESYSTEGMISNLSGQPRAFRAPISSAALQTSWIIQSAAARLTSAMWTTKDCPGLAGPAGAQVEEEVGKLRGICSGVQRESPSSEGCLKHTRLVSKWRILKTVLPKGEGWDAVRKQTGIKPRSKLPELRFRPQLTPQRSSWAPLPEDGWVFLVSSKLLACLPWEWSFVAVDSAAVITVLGADEFCVTQLTQ